MSMINQVDLLKAMAIKLYHLDGGEMHECTSHAEYVALIAEHGTAEAAWAYELQAHLDREEYYAETASSWDIPEMAEETTPELITDERTEYYGCPEHVMFGDAWLYRDCPGAW